MHRVGRALIPFFVLGAVLIFSPSPAFAYRPFVSTDAAVVAERKNHGAPSGGGVYRPDAGRIMIDEEIVAANGQNFREPEERSLGMVFQDLALWPHLSVKGNLEFGLKAWAIPAKERDQRVAEVLRLTEMGSSIDVNVADLSGGEQQRIALARALVLYPKTLLMDEPLSSLDFELNLQLRREILRLQAQFSFTLVYVTHNLEEAFDLATRIVVMKKGRIDQVGEPEEISGRFHQIHRRIGSVGNENSRLESMRH